MPQARPALQNPTRQLAAFAAALALTAVGCVERLLQVRSEPPGARVRVNGAPVWIERHGERVAATTPVDVPFEFHGSFEVRVESDTRPSATRIVEVPAPFYAYPPLDILVEYLWPGRIQEHHRVRFELGPEPVLEDAAESKALQGRVEAARALLEGGAETRESAGAAGERE